MARKRTLSPKKKVAMFAGAAMLVGGVAWVTTGTSQASVTCDGLNTALSNNQKFIAAQQANPDAQSAARIANRQDVIKQIQVQQKAAGCPVGDAAAPPAEQGPPADQGQGQEEAPPAEAVPPADGGQAAGEVVCAGSTVTLSGEDGAPAATSNQFPVGTTLKVTNLDNGKSTTVQVTGTSGSCALLNNAAFEQVREAGKFLIRNPRIERVG